ncbi:MAG: hypothetical protein QGF59_15415, partial [Pirellulaceae bacterium]|nr:hypothetical protein [Pirellulaceae bacterium]
FPQTTRGLIQWDWRRQERLKRRQPGSQSAVSEAIMRGEALLRDLRRLGLHDTDAAAAKLDVYRRRTTNLPNASKTKNRLLMIGTSCISRLDGL